MSRSLGRLLRHGELLEYESDGEHLLTVTAPGDRVTSYTYDTGTSRQQRHALTSVTYADQTHDYFTYDDRGRLQEMYKDGGAEKVTFDYPSPGGVTVSDATGRESFLGYGLGGQLAQVRDGEGRVSNYGYDLNSQLTTFVGPGGEKYRYAYDTRGNLTTVEDPLHQLTQFNFEALFNQLATVTDARGNGMDYAYDTRGNLTSITYEDGTRESYSYDAAGNVLRLTNRRARRHLHLQRSWPSHKARTTPARRASSITATNTMRQAT